MTVDTAKTAKVPAVTLGFWVIKILATTLGETGGDAVTMSLNLGYLVGTLIFGAIFALAIALQMSVKRFHPFLYWFVIVATTTVGTTMADFADRSLGIGYPGGSLLLMALLAASFALWYRTMGTVDVASVASPAAEAFYWITIMFSQTLGTALGDWVADSGLGYGGGAIVFGAAIAVAAALYYWTALSRTALFWIVFVLTRPLGATVGDYLDKPIDQGGLALSRYTASIGLAMVILLLIVVLPQKPASRAH